MSTIRFYPRTTIPYSYSVLADAADIALNNGSTTVLTSVSQNIKRVIYQAPSTNTVPIRIGGGSIGAARGFELQPGAHITLDQNNIVNFAFAAAAGQTISLTGFR